MKYDTLCMRAAKALKRLRVCAASSEPWLLADAISTKISYCWRPWPAANITIMQNTHQIQVLTEPLSRAQAIFYSLPNNERGTK